MWSYFCSSNFDVGAASLMYILAVFGEDHGSLMAALSIESYSRKCEVAPSRRGEFRRQLRAGRREPAPSLLPKKRTTCYALRSNLFAWLRSGHHRADARDDSSTADDHRFRGILQALTALVVRSDSSPGAPPARHGGSWRGFSQPRLGGIWWEAAGAW